MKKVYTKLGNKEKVATDDILDEIIAFQLKKMEKHDKQSVLTEASEKAMENFIELLKLRYSMHK